MTYEEELREVQTTSGVLPYRLIRKPVKNINLRIRPEGIIYVSANESVPAEYIDAFVRSKQRSIRKALLEYAAYNAHEGQPKQYVSGENFCILGKNVRLKVLEGTNPSVIFDGIFIYLTVKNKKDRAAKQRIMTEWLTTFQKETFRAVCQKIHKTLEKYRIAFPEIGIRYMRSRWGSCQPEKNKITLNSRLIETPKICIEYVVLHEMTHFLYPNHSEAFYDFLSAAMPDWKERKKKLEAFF